MRLFVAIEVPHAWREAAASTRAQLEVALGADVHGELRWVEARLLHLTLRFLGEVDGERLPALQEALETQVGRVHLGLALEAAATFGPPARTAVVWLGVAGDGLEALARSVDAAVVAATALPPDERPLRPHLTLARVRRQAEASQRRALAEAVRGLQTPPAAAFRATSIALVRSHLGPRGPRYEVLSRHPAADDPGQNS